MRLRVDRRQVLAKAALAAAALWPWSASAQTVKTKLILLGTGGGPRPRKASSAPAQVIVINDTPYQSVVGARGLTWFAAVSAWRENEPSRLIARTETTIYRVPSARTDRVGFVVALARMEMYSQ